MTTEERLAKLEHDVAELMQARRIQEDRDIALLARIDTFIDSLSRVERVQLRSFEELKADQQEIKTGMKRFETELEALKVGQKTLESGQQNMVTALSNVGEVLRDHKAAIERIDEGQRALQAGQEQILAILTGKSKTND